MFKASHIGGNLDTIDTEQVLNLLENQITNDGLVGFGKYDSLSTHVIVQIYLYLAAPGIQPDVDDSANASIILNLLGRPGLSRQIRERFEGDTHFKTYEGEVGESPSANCNVLLALLLNLQHDPGAIPAVGKTVKYLASTWFSTNGSIMDKWVGALAFP